ncbi:MAG: hypothetical protein IKL96_02595 [Kiritimatiellae bacterium]|nr:hypothetical protein [Kiritimatiellia bacterium]
MGTRGGAGGGGEEPIRAKGERRAGEAAMSEAASEIFGARERPYDFRWGTPQQVSDQFGICVQVLKAAWKRGWVRARQGNWVSDEKRTQTVYCFEDIHGWLERVAHKVSEAYAEKWWTDETIATLEEKTPDGPYLRAKAHRPNVRKDGFAPLPRNGML